MDSGLLVIAIFVGIIALAVWAMRSAKRDAGRYPGGLTPQPGQRDEGARLPNRGSGDAEGANGH